jgi:hypothetical protein
MGQTVDTSQVHVDQILDNISIAYRNPEYIAMNLFPRVGVQKDSDKYYLFNQPEWFRDEAGFRAPGSEGKYGQWGTSTAGYSCQEINYSALLPDEIRQNSDPGIDPEATSVEYATDKILLKTERIVSALVQTSGNWATSNGPTYQWSDFDNSDPIADIKAMRATIRGLIGRSPNTLVFSERVFEKVQDHPLVLDRLPVNVPQFIDLQFLARAFMVDQILVGKAIYATTGENQAGTASYSDVWNDNVWLGFVAPRPELRMPSAGYVFESGPRSIQVYRKDEAHSNRYEARVKQDVKIVSTICGGVLTDVLA